MSENPASEILYKSHSLQKTMPLCSVSKRKVRKLSKKTDHSLYTKLLGDLDKDIKDLEQQFSFLKSEVFQYGAAIDRSYLQLQSEVSRAAKASKSRAALLMCQKQLTDEAFQFLYRQQLSYSKPHWDVHSSKLPILLAKCGLRVWDVLQGMFRLPCKPTLLKYKAQARQDPSLFNNSILMNKFVQKQYKSRFNRARRRDSGIPKISRTKSSVSDFLRDYLEKNNIQTS